MDRLVDDAHAALADLIEDSVAAQQESLGIPGQKLPDLKPSEDSIRDQGNGYLPEVVVVKALGRVLDLVFGNETAALKVIEKQARVHGRSSGGDLCARMLAANRNHESDGDSLSLAPSIRNSLNRFLQAARLRYLTSQL